MPVVGLLEKIDSDAERFLQKRLSRVPPENTDADANVRWGQSGSDPSIASPQVSVTIYPPSTDPDPESDFSELVYYEVSRSEQEIKVVNPDDEEQFVMVKRISSITFSGPDGRGRRFVLNWPS